MAFTISDAEKILKTTYGPGLANQLNDRASVLLANIKKVPIYSDEIKVASPVGINGGTGFSSDGGDLPSAGGQMYSNFVLGTKNVYIPIEFSDKVFKATRNSAGSFFDVAKKEFESAEIAGKFNLGRSVYGDGTGNIATISALADAGNTVTVTAGLRNLKEGLIVDFFADSGTTAAIAGRRITSINRGATNTITFDGAATTLAAGFITVQKSFGNELTGLGSIFSDSAALYGVTRATNGWINPIDRAAVDNAIDNEQIFDVLATLEDVKGSSIDFIVCGTTAYKVYSSYLDEIRKSTVPSMELKGGFSAITYTYNNKTIPVVQDPFADDDAMYFLEKDKLGMYSLGDWEWISHTDGSIIQRVSNKPVYQAVMSRYCNLLCERPGGIGRIKGISA